LIQTYSAHGYEVLSLAVAADNARFASAGGDRSVFLWDVATAQTIRRFAGHSSRVNSVAFGGADDALLVSGGFDTTVRIWDCRSRSAKPVQVLSEARDGITSVARCTTDVIGASVTGLGVSRDAKTVLVSALDSKVRLMDRDRGTCLRAYHDAGWRNEELRVQAVLGGKEKWVMAGDEMTAAPSGAESGAGDPTAGRVWAWDLLTGKLAAKVQVPWGPQGAAGAKKVVGRDGKEKERKNVVSCIAWREGGFGDQFCVGGTSGVVTVFGPRVER
jgi:mitogen-activated protein kinase organizer 1